MKQKNIVLIGMSGSGKTTIGKLLAKKLSMQFIDTDELIEREEGEKIKDIFERCGEAYFRTLETECAKKMSQTSGIVVATGGGMILKEENMAFLKENSVTVYLKRSVESIKQTMDASNRPLLSSGLKRLYDMERERTPLYEGYADFIVLNEAEPEKTVDEIINYIKNII